MEINKTTVIALIIAGLVAGTVIGAIATYQIVRIKTTGKIVTVGVEVYSDLALTKPLTDINWGNIQAGQQSYVDCYIKNIQNSDVTLTIETENFSPTTAQQYLTVTWDIQTDYVLQVGAWKKTRITLTVSANAKDVTNFSFDIIIKATAQQ